MHQKELFWALKNLLSDMLYKMIIYKALSLPKQWLSNRAVDLRSNGRWFETYQMHCVVSLAETHHPLLSTGSTQEDRKLYRHD